MYTTTKFGLRGFQEALSLELFRNGHSDYIKTTTICPYFVNTIPFISNVVNKGMHFKLLYSVGDCGNVAIDGILGNKEVVTLPSWWYYFFYLM